MTYIPHACVGLVLGLWGFILGPRGFPDINMLVSATQTTHVGGRTQHERLHVAVEYRLYSGGL